MSDFPSFFAECCFRDGERDARDGKIGASICPHHGPIAVEWYGKGVTAAMTEGPSAFDRFQTATCLIAEGRKDDARRELAAALDLIDRAGQDRNMRDDLAALHRSLAQ